MANNTGLDEADIEPGDFRTRLCQNATGLWFTPSAKFRILKIHAAETRPGKRPPRWEAPDFPRQRPAHCPLTLGNVGGPHTAGNDGAETALVGWGESIRTSELQKLRPSNSMHTPAPSAASRLAMQCPESARRNAEDARKRAGPAASASTALYGTLARLAQRYPPCGSPALPESDGHRTHRRRDRWV